MGRRTDDDQRQVNRWLGVCGEKGRWKRRLANMCAAKSMNGENLYNDISISPVIRQTLLHWSYELTEKDVHAAMKRMK